MQCKNEVMSHKSDDFEVFSLLILKILPIVSKNEEFHSILIY